MGKDELGSILKANYLSRGEIAEALGVSVHTVHNWCSGRVRIPLNRMEQVVRYLETSGVDGEITASLVQHEAEIQGFNTDLLPGRLGKEARGPVVILAWDLARSSIFGPVARLCRETLEHMGRECLLLDCSGEHRIKRSYVKQAVSMKAAGILLAGVPGEIPDPDDDLLSTIEPAVRNAVPVVVIKPWSGTLDLPRGTAGVGWDASSAVGMAIDLLLELGHQDISGLMSSRGPAGRSHEIGFNFVAEKRGLHIKQDSLVWPMAGGEHIQDVERLIHESSAVFAHPSTLNVIAHACYDQHITWPDDISIVSLGHSQSIPRFGPRPFTYVSLPVGKVSRTAAHLLMTLVSREERLYGQEFSLFGPSAMGIVNVESGSVRALGTPLTAGAA